MKEPLSFTTIKRIYRELYPDLKKQKTYNDFCQTCHEYIGII
jgi:hypothetical protein